MAANVSGQEPPDGSVVDEGPRIWKDSKSSLSQQTSENKKITNGIYLDLILLEQTHGFKKAVFTKIIVSTLIKLKAKMLEKNSNNITCSIFIFDFYFTTLEFSSGFSFRLMLNYYLMILKFTVC